jgi:hypothetical protein
MMYDNFLEAFASWYRQVSYQIENNSFGQIFLNFQESFLHSTFVITLEIIAAVATILLIFGLAYVVGKQKELNQKSTLQDVSGVIPTAAGPLQSQWHDILHHVESVREVEWKFAVIEADKITDSVLRARFPGDTMGERLMNIDKTKLLSIEGLWEAHKIRNRLAHDVNYFLRHAEALRAVRFYEAALKELSVIE